MRVVKRLMSEAEIRRRTVFYNWFDWAEADCAADPRDAFTPTPIYFNHPGWLGYVNQELDERVG